MAEHRCRLMYFAHPGAGRVKAAEILAGVRWVHSVCRRTQRYEAHIWQQKKQVWQNAGTLLPFAATGLYSYVGVEGRESFCICAIPASRQAACMEQVTCCPWRTGLGLRRLEACASPADLPWGI